MKKTIKYLFIFICAFVLFLDNVYAAGYSVSVTSNSVTVGNSVTLTISGSDLAGKFIISSSNASVASLSSGSIWIDNNSGTVTINTSKAGTATITITPDDVADYSKNVITEVKSVTITVKEKLSNNGGGSNNSYVPPKKSTNNNLSSLTIDGYSLEQEFNKDNLEYSATVSSGTEKININAQLADSSAKVTGIGEKELIAGENNFEIKVTAQNGDVKTYKLRVSVLPATMVEVSEKKYTIVEKEGVLEPLSGYNKSTVKIDDKEVLSYYNEVTKYNLVVLKDEEGNNNYYLYDNGKYSLYKEYNFSGVRLYLLNDKKPDNYVLREMTINDEKIPAYQLDTSKKNTTYALDADSISNYYLVYAMNINTGNKNYYLIDKLENTAIRYDEELNSLFMDINTNNDNYKTYFFITLGTLGIVMVSFGIALIVNGKKKKNKYKFK